MTLQQVIRELECIRDNAYIILASGFGQKEGEHDLIYRRDFEFATTAIKAVEKQIPKKPIGLSVSHEGRLGNCPCCNKLVLEELDKIGCQKCLQKLDWSTEDDN